jgi:hypothetical protein
LKAANKALWTWGLVCLAAWCGAGCTPWNFQPRIDPTRALIDARTVLRAAAEDPHDIVARREAMQAIGEVDAEEGEIGRAHV